MNTVQNNQLSELSAHVGQRLRSLGLLLVTAESCTGGWVAQTVTDSVGSSGWFERGFITYSNAAKCEMLSVNPATLAAFGAVSETTVEEMALGALRHSHAQVSLAVSGIAGPLGGTREKPVGFICLAWATTAGALTSRTLQFSGDRVAVRHQAVVAALAGLLEFIA